MDDQFVGLQRVRTKVKMFSLLGSSFPSVPFFLAYQWPAEFKAQEMEGPSFADHLIEDPCGKGTSYLRTDHTVGAYRAWYFKGNAGAGRKVATNSQLGTAGADIHGSSKLNELVTAIIHPVHKNRDGEWQTLPVTTVRLGECLHRTCPWNALGGIYIAKSPRRSASVLNKPTMCFICLYL